MNNVRNLYTGQISNLLKSVKRTGVIPDFKAEVEVPAEVEVLYQRLVDAYRRHYGTGKLLVDQEVETYMRRRGINRKEAITKLAEDQGIT